jgi:two-component system, OmpR family, response regulator ChvI
MSQPQHTSALETGAVAPAADTDRIGIVLVEDDDNFREAATGELEDLGFDVRSFADGAELFASWADCVSAQVLVLDWYLKGDTGDALLLALRREGIQLPVVFLTGRAAPPLETLALDRGALDFVDKSRGMPILAKHLKVIAQDTKTALPEAPKLELGPLTLNHRVSRAFWNDTDVYLTLTEFKIVHLLASTPGKPITYRAIYDCMHHEGFVAGFGEDGFRTNVRSSIKRIRNKIKAFDPSFDDIENHASVGYCWKPRFRSIRP